MNSITFYNKRTFPTKLNLGKMATNREMLKEAIADAKAVKETAIANAKAALEEAFTPQIKSMFAAKLQEMEEEDLKEEGFGKMTADSDEGFSSMGEKALDETDDKDADDKMMEVDLEELLAELNEEEEVEESLNEAEDEMKEAKDEDLKEAEEEEESEESEETEEEGEPIDLEDMTDEDLKSMIEDVIKDMVENGELEAGNEDMKGEEGSEELEDVSGEEEEIDLAELLREIEGMEEAEENESIDEAKMKKEKEEKKEDEDKKKMKKELDEAYSAIETLKSELNEINLLNAKLLYSNKIFKAKNLNESQKVKVLTSFDKAKNVGEVKMVFETLNEGIKVSKNTIKEHLGSASKGTSTPNLKKPIVESNEAFARMQKLAGII